MLINSRLRWVGIVFLILAGSMLVWGQTLLKPWLAGMGFVIYWLLCFVFTGLAILVALLDIWAVRRQIREQHMRLVERTLTKVAQAGEARSNKDLSEAGNDAGAPAQSDTPSPSRTAPSRAQP